MSLKAGIVGLPNVGKSTLFNAITKAGALMANYPFATIEPNVGMVEVKDERLDKLVEMYHPKSVVRTSFMFTDIAGLVKGASKGEGLGNQFLSHIREVDAICHVVRCFEDTNITHVSGKIDPIDDIETINLELIMSDLEVVENRLPKIEKKAQFKTDKDSVVEYEILSKLKDAFLNGKPARSVSLSDNEKLIVKNFSFLTMKPVMYVCNVKEDEAVSGNKYTELVKEYASKEGSRCVVISAKIEEELSELSEDEAQMFKEELGLETSGLDTLISEAYSMLGLKTFLTAGEKECRCWTFKDGMKAPECAGIIHSDFEKGFIKAEIVSFEDLVKSGSEKAAKEAGLYRLEGKDYLMKDGDVVVFRFNV